MKKLIPLFFLILFFSSCKKSVSDLIWERSFSKGEAFVVKQSADSGFAACGFSAGKPLFVRFDKSRALVKEISGTNAGLFSSFWFDENGYVIGGNVAGKMVITRYSQAGNLLWEKTINTGFTIDLTFFNYSGNGSLLALGTASPDSSYITSTGLYFVRFDTTGLIIEEKSIPDTKFLASGSFMTDNSGNIFLPLTRRAPGAKSRASVAKFNNQFAKLWETELSNNPNFGAASIKLILNETGNIFVTGRTELSSATGNINNSFVSAITPAGLSLWKSYLESTNTGTDLSIDTNGDLMVLNKNCCIVRYLAISDGTDAGILRLLSQCNSKNSSVFGYSVSEDNDGNLLVAGQHDENFFVSVKASQ